MKDTFLLGEVDGRPVNDFKKTNQDAINMKSGLVICPMIPLQQIIILQPQVQGLSL